MVYAMLMKFLAVFFCAALSLSAQTNPPASGRVVTTVSPNAQAVHEQCVEGRRLICGKIIKILPDGLVVDSGYTNLTQPPLNTSWLIPGRVSAGRPATLIEGRSPGAVCVGPVFLSDLPRGRGPVLKPQLYDYVVVLGYPAGSRTYASVGGVKKNVRWFAANLTKAVDMKLTTGERPGK